MPSSFNKDNQQTVESLEPLLITCSSLQTSTEQSKYSLPKSIATQTESSPNYFHHVKQLEFQFQEQDSSSNLSSCQSHYTMTNMARDNTTLQHLASCHGCDETCPRDAERYQRPSLPHDNAEFPLGQVQLDYSQSMACIPYPWAESYFPGLVAAYGPNALIYPQMVGITPARVPIPLRCAESIPVYVNAKQFRAILKRRQARAKLEAQNKIFKSRKPYLHESRHRHALKRPRGSGGRFLNTKNTKQSESSSPNYCNYLSVEKLCKDASVSEFQNSESGSWGTSTPSGSDVTSIFNGDDIFHQREIMVSRSSFRIDVQVGEDLTNLEAGNMLLLSIDGGARK